ncbi:AAA family ATPase [Clostridium scatologenes]|uniref:ATPase AAA-type core domain-containing protein n=1 Tax=Clostridium scatologenes TaxID=1548 RepID=A0A0E3M4P1_CLOSL|nr:AAA family ATPase [Clostridium scatologenes]AKA67213.1 hypothetical protein CSCA_0088 [Clostridium scatologenes]
MELIYIWIEKFRNYEKKGVALSDKFSVKYNTETKRVNLKKNRNVSAFPEFISNISAIVGKNSVGKTNFLDLIGLRKPDRNKNNAEFEVRYKNRNKNKWGFLTNLDIESEIKNSIYFFIYYWGIDTLTGQDLFVVEGNDIESFSDIFEQHEEISDVYWRSKYWFAFICSYENDKFIYKYKVNEHLDYYKDTKEDKRYSDYVPEQDKYAIINFRNDFNELYYDQYQSMKDSDDSYIHIPRRSAYFNSKLLSYKIKTLHDIMQNSNRSMYKDKQYTIKIYFNSTKNDSFMDDEERLKLKHTFEKVHKKDKALIRILESYTRFFYFSFYNDKFCSEEDKNSCKKCLESLSIKKETLEEYIEYHKKAIEFITSSYKIDEKEYIIDYYNELVSVLQKNIDNITITEESIKFLLEEDSDVIKFTKLVQVIYDSRYEEPFSPFGNFFYKYKVYYLSDGEDAYLGLYASINEQIKLWTRSKEKFILLFDEPEIKMHPELSRNFINDLIKFLNIINKGNQKFQIILTTHSPFILSDIPKMNVVRIERCDDGRVKLDTNNLNTFGQNIHVMLRNDFFMQSTIGEFAKTQINKVVDFLKNDGKCSDNMTAEKAKYIIDNIGEPIVKHKLEKMYNEIFPNYEDKIKSLQVKLFAKQNIDKTVLITLKQQLEKTLEGINDTLQSEDEEND